MHYDNYFFISLASRIYRVEDRSWCVPVVIEVFIKLRTQLVY